VVGELAVDFQAERVRAFIERHFGDAHPADETVVGLGGDHQAVADIFFVEIDGRPGAAVELVIHLAGEDIAAQPDNQGHRLDQYRAWPGDVNAWRI